MSASLPADSPQARAGVERFARHTFVWLRSDGALLQPARGSDESVVMHAWAQARRPFIVRRPDAPSSSGTGGADTVSLGLPLPPAMGKRRIAFNTATESIVRSTAPPTLAHVRPHAPYEWRKDLALLARMAQAKDLDLRVFGSLAWQALTGLPYVTAYSDADLFVCLRDRVMLRHAIEILAGWERQTARRADAELWFPGERAVAWREWRDLSSDAGRVLVKTRSSVVLLRASVVSGALPALA